ncbi:phosphoribosylanthranilate isomerase [Aquimarina sp. MAR_2010_214]|uniref:phosphoribosylanthranilate isomerase n=1 Tax=Aquimarina sp. MAR_2010_214 TaxID=1250026 RepID=UPI000C70324D|nr:phosphoribosylanthranilate isomerase [Aquimarina sp. MAR_2010_214]PKV52412.1 phosphoribosylanthranilate isomerase [Aquimarina sp. MAR_2010_214]
MKLKVCGMKYHENIKAAAALKPDYLGFIFYENSPRNFEGEIPKLPDHINKVGVFVNESINQVVSKIAKHSLDAIQLHGDESPEYCKALKEVELSLPVSKNGKEIGFERYNFEVWKVFSIKDQFDFKVLQPYEGVVDYFLFDTKGKEKGGNGYTFDWSVLKGYPSSTPFILSGGIGLDEIEAVVSFQESPESKYLHAIDVNSKFESEPGLKKTENLEKFIKRVIST